MNMVFGWKKVAWKDFLSQQLSGLPYKIKWPWVWGWILARLLSGYYEHLTWSSRIMFASLYEYIIARGSSPDYCQVIMSIWHSRLALCSPVWGFICSSMHVRGKELNSVWHRNTQKQCTGDTQRDTQKHSDSALFQHIPKDKEKL